VVVFTTVGNASKMPLPSGELMTAPQ
jgi:hypothetical protein